MLTGLALFTMTAGAGFIVAARYCPHWWADDPPRPRHYAWDVDDPQLATISLGANTIGAVLLIGGGFTMMCIALSGAWSN